MKYTFYFIAILMILTGCKTEPTKVEEQKIKFAIDEHNKQLSDEYVARVMNKVDRQSELAIKYFLVSHNTKDAEAKAAKFTDSLDNLLIWARHRDDSLESAKYKNNYFIGVDSALTYDKYVSFCKENHVEFLDGFKYLKSKK